MSFPEGVYSIGKTTLASLCDPKILTRSANDSWYEFGIRWEDGELADDVLAVETDGYFDGDDTMTFEGKDYRLEFGEDLIGDVLAASSALSHEQRPEETVALRYMIEFDAFFSPETVSTGAKWLWGNMGGQAKRRTPEEFHAKWGVSPIAT